MSVSPYLSHNRIIVELDAHNITEREVGREVSLVLPSDHAQGDLKFNDIIRIGLLHFVYPFKPLL